MDSVPLCLAYPSFARRHPCGHKHFNVAKKVTMAGMFKRWRIIPSDNTLDFHCIPLVYYKIQLQRAFEMAAARVLV